MKTSVAIMAHPSRRSLVNSLITKLDHPTVVWDEKGNRWDTGRRSMLAFDPEADWHLVVQDDAVLCRQFLSQVRRGLMTVEKGPACFYMGRSGKFARSGTQWWVARAQMKGKTWICHKGPWWGVAVAVRVEDILPMVEWCDGRPEIANYDRRMSRYFEHAGQACWYSVPSLANHRVGKQNPSLVAGRRSNRGRTAAWFRKSGQMRNWNPEPLIVRL